MSKIFCGALYNCSNCAVHMCVYVYYNVYLWGSTRPRPATYTAGMKASRVTCHALAGAHLETAPLVMALSQLTLQQLVDGFCRAMCPPSSVCGSCVPCHWWWCCVESVVSVCPGAWDLHIASLKVCVSGYAMWPYHCRTGVMHLYILYMCIRWVWCYLQWLCMSLQITPRYCSLLPAQRGTRTCASIQTVLPPYVCVLCV